ncbi:MAG: DUF6263 family protein [Chitinophagaceae bacterium]
MTKGITRLVASRSMLVLHLVSVSLTLCAQKTSSRLQMQQGARFEIRTTVSNLLAQQFNGNSIDFNTDGTATHEFVVTNATDDNYTLRHKLQALNFGFEGMGVKRKFDSKNEKDLSSEFGRPVRDLLSQSYDMVIDTLGVARLVLAPSAAPSEGQDQFKLISSLLGDLLQVVNPPQKGDPTIFMAWPGGEMAVGESWTISKKAEKESYSTQYTLVAVTDTAMVVDFVGTGQRRVENEMRGMQSVVNLKTSTNGRILVHPATGIVFRRTTTVESTGTTEIMGSSTPVSGKTTIVDEIRPVEGGQ